VSVGLYHKKEGICTVAFAISYNHEYSQFIHECVVAFVNTTLSRMRQLIHEGKVSDTQLFIHDTNYLSNSASSGYDIPTVAPLPRSHRRYHSQRKRDIGIYSELEMEKGTY
jgi:hypothetical protein